MTQLKGKLLKIYNATIKKYELTDTTLVDSIIQKFGACDPSETNKYVQLMVDIFMSETKSDNEIINLVIKHNSVENKISPKIFDKLDAGIYDNENVKNNPKDIQNYKTFNDLETVYNLAKDFVTKKEASNKIVDEQTDIIYDGDDYTIISPLTFQSSCYWGVDTKWCTTSKNDDNYFKKYTTNGTLFYVIDNYRKDDKTNPMGKFAIHIRDSHPLENADIFNRPDDPMGHGAEKFLPKSLVDKLKNYIKNGGVANIVNIFKEWGNYKSSVTKLDLPDDWYQIESNSPLKDSIMLFTSDNFKSYCCQIKLRIDEQTNESIMSSKWVRNDEDVNVVICSNSDVRLPLRNLTRNLRGKNHSIFSNMVENTILLKDGSYGIVRLKLLNDVIKYHCNNYLFDGWYFTVVDKQLTKSQQNGLFTKGERSITNLGIYSFNIRTTLKELSDYSISAVINFNNNTFNLLPGETNEITWDEQSDSFQLLYYTEDGIKKLMNQFKIWVEKTIINKSQTIINDLYGDNALLINSKNNAFDDYLTLEDIPLPKLKTNVKIEAKKPKRPKRPPVGMGPSKDINDYLDEIFNDLKIITTPKRPNDFILPF